MPAIRRDSPRLEGFMKQGRAYLAVTCLVLVSVFAAGIWQPDHRAHRTGLSAVCRTHQCACSLAQRCEINCCCQQGSPSAPVVKDDDHHQSGRPKLPELRNSDCVPFQGLGLGLFRLPSVVFPFFAAMPAATAVAPNYRRHLTRAYWVDADPRDKIPITALFHHI